MKISAVVITYNESRNIDECLRSVSFCDEIVLVDSNSTDDTVWRARKYTSRIFTRQFDNFAAQKNFGMDQAKSPWLLSIDADERVTEPLRYQIQKAIENSGNIVAYRIRRKTKFLGKWMRFSGMQSDKPIRLILKGKGTFLQPIHEHIVPSGRVAHLNSSLLHETTPTVAEELRKTELYTDLEVLVLKQKGRHATPIGSGIRVIATFLSHYVFHLGFLDGYQGFQFAYYATRYTARKYKKLTQSTNIQTKESKIREVFDGSENKLPSEIDRNDSRLRAILNSMGPLSGKKMLEVGCGKGRFARVMCLAGIDIFGLDLSFNLLRSAHASGFKKIAQGSVVSLPYANDTFDLIYTVEVIEHLPSLEIAFREMHRILKVGGKVIVVDRNRYSFSDKRCLVPNIIIKTWHELKNDWFYPRNFIYQERWFSKNQIVKILELNFGDVSGTYLLSDGEKKCDWHNLFNWVPIMRHFIMWQGTKFQTVNVHQATHT